MPALARYLGLAFAAADCLFEVDGSGRIVFAIGSDGGKDGGADRRLVGRQVSDVVTAEDGVPIGDLFKALRPGRRLGPTRVRLRTAEGGARTADLSVFSIPDLHPHVSCALTYVAEAAGEAAPAEAQLDGGTFRDQVRDQLAVAASRGRELSLALVEIKGLIEARQTLAPADMAALLHQIQARIAQHAPESALAELSEERFAILHGAAGEPAGLMQALSALAGPPGGKLEVAGQSVKLSPRWDPLQQFRAVRTALDCFLSAGLPKDEASLQRSFQAVLDETARSAGRLGSIIEERRFDLYYQPVVQLSTGLTSHYEVLVRFDRGVGPAPLIKLAEDLALIERLDALVAEQAVRRLRSPGSERLKLAINVSGASLLNDGYLERLLTASNSGPGLRARLLLEITESAALQDLDAAGRRIRALRDAGFEVAIDDFGAGAASFDYLRALPVTGVKIDGRYVRGVDRDERAQTIIKHLVSLCSELQYVTVAEMVEREEELATVAALGVDCGQGWAFGRPEPEPCEPARRPTQRARRVGEQETWG
jgi:EAL domain-containing protein (putative c-di-GMP-specific phosphodiesterase class I)